MKVTEEELIKIIKEIRKILRAQAKNYDTEEAHKVADDVLCDLLTALGYDSIVKLYNKVDKWYA